VRGACGCPSLPEYQSGALTGQVTSSRAVYGFHFELVRDCRSSRDCATAPAMST
jgi:hypothetical protein